MCVSFLLTTIHYYDIYHIKGLNSFLKTDGGGKWGWVNDGFCDDMNNNEKCEFDGGDCCGVNVDKRYCLDCRCIS